MFNFCIGPFITETKTTLYFLCLLLTKNIIQSLLHLRVTELMYNYFFQLCSRKFSFLSCPMQDKFFSIPRKYYFQHPFTIPSFRPTKQSVFYFCTIMYKYQVVYLMSGLCSFRYKTK